MHTSNRSTSPLQTPSFWIIIGVVCSCLQFGVSEILHQLNMRGFGPEDDSFFELSDTIAWPAGHVYDAVQVQLLEKGLARVAAGGAPFTEEQQTQAAAFVEQFPTFPEGDERENLETFLWGVETLVDDITVGTQVEYGIYLGTCICWGILIALAGYLVFRKVEDPAMM